MAKMLMDNYAGIAQAVNLVAEFLILAGILELLFNIKWMTWFGSIFNPKLCLAG